MESGVVHVFSPVPVVTAPVDAAPDVRRARSGLSAQGHTPPANQGPRAQPAWGGTAPVPIRQPRRTHVAVKLTQAPGPHHVATTPKRRRLRCLVSCQGMKPNWRPCRPLLTDPHPPPRDSPPAGPANWASALALRHVPRSPLAPGGVAPCSPSDGIWDVSLPLGERVIRTRRATCQPF